MEARLTLQTPNWSTQRCVVDAISFVGFALASATAKNKISIPALHQCNELRSEGESAKQLKNGSSSQLLQ